MERENQKIQNGSIVKNIESIYEYIENLENTIHLLKKEINKLQKENHVQTKRRAWHF